MKLPIGYKELEYIETTGEQYIDTLFKPTSNSAIEIIFQSSATTGGLCVCDTSWKNNGFGIWVHAACFGNAVKTVIPELSPSRASLLPP